MKVVKKETFKIDWMDRSKIIKANKEILKMNFVTELEKCRNILIFRILLFSGIEGNELRTLKEENFLIEDDYMYIKIFKTPSRPERVIDIPKPYIIEYFDKYKELKANSDLFFYDEKDPVKQIHKDLVTQIVAGVLNFAKIKVSEKNPTMLRKSFILNLHNEKNPETGLTMDKKEIQKLSGIKNTTQLNKILTPSNAESKASKHFLDLITS